MTQENKELLLKDLSARLPYGVIIEGLEHPEIMTIKHLAIISVMPTEPYKPYLRPMSSMTEEEAKEIATLRGLKNILSVQITDEYIDVIIDDGFSSTEMSTIWYDEIISSIEIFDWLNVHHFDYRGLIDKGLAIAVTKENNPYKE